MGCVDGTHTMKSVWALIFAVVLALLAGHGACVNSVTNDAVFSFLRDVQTQLEAVSRVANLAQWAYNTNITEHTQARAIEADAQYSDVISQALNDAQARGYFSSGTRKQVNATVARLLDVLQLSAGDPKDTVKRDRLSQVSSTMEGIYSSAKLCDLSFQAECMELDPDMDLFMAESRDYAQLSEVWQKWRSTVGPQLRDLYQEYVQLQNQGATDWGFRSAAHLWLSGYDMQYTKVAPYVRTVFAQLQPLYRELQAYIRSKIYAHYGTTPPSDGTIEAHLLGNMWAQTWEHVYELVKPYPASGGGVDVTDELVAQGYTTRRMMKLGESFYTSLGFDPLPQGFWNYSMMEKPDGRDVVCHASAWDLGQSNQTDVGGPAESIDLRIKMCTKQTQEDLLVIHHELGHLFYDQSYAHQPYLFRGGANDGFHEAIGDTVRLSVTVPSHLREIGLLSNGGNAQTQAVPSDLTAEEIINYQMSVALEKVAFPPFGLMIDEWRWRVFDGDVDASEYNRLWWELRRKYQGIVPPLDDPVDRSARASQGDDDAPFDPGCKYHVPAGVPYLRYFIAHVLQFQFHEALCEAAYPDEATRPALHECSIYNSSLAGARFKAMLWKGLSQPWQQTLSEILGTGPEPAQLSAQPILDYFAPLYNFLKDYNDANGVQRGWTGQFNADTDINPSAQSGEEKTDSETVKRLWEIFFVVCLIALVIGIIMYCRKRQQQGDYRRSAQYISEGLVDDMEDGTLASDDALRALDQRTESGYAMDTLGERDGWSDDDDSRSWAQGTRLDEEGV